MNTIYSHTFTQPDLEAMVAKWDSFKLKPGEECQSIPGEPWQGPCTGVHSHSRPHEEWCPRTKALDRRWDSTSHRSMYKTLWALRERIDAGPDGFRQHAATLRAEGFEEIAQGWERRADAEEANQSHRDRPISGASEPFKRKMRERLAEMQRDE